MIPTPTGHRRLATDDGWVLFFYGDNDVLGYVWDVNPYWSCWF